MFSLNDLFFCLSQERKLTQNLCFPIFCKEFSILMYDLVKWQKT